MATLPGTEGRRMLDNTKIVNFPSVWAAERVSPASGQTGAGEALWVWGWARMGLELGLKGW